jgi:chromosome segregation ATPase
MRLSKQQLADNETKIRTAMSQLLNGDIPPGGKCDIKTLAREADVDRTAFYGSRPYAHLRDEFEQRLAELRSAGERPDPRDAQVDRLKDEITRLRERLTRSDAAISELSDFRGQALARLAAQHDELTRLRQEVRLAAEIRRLPAARHRDEE